MRYTVKNEEFSARLSGPEYEFLQTNPSLGGHIMFLTPSGSYAYGLEGPQSDLDVRGVALPSPTELLGLHQKNDAWGFEQVERRDLDVTVFCFPKFAALLANGSPNAIEMMGGSPTPYTQVSHAGQLLLDNWEVFLSQKVIHAYDGFLAHQKQIIQKCAELQHGKLAKSQSHLLRVYATASDLLTTGRVIVRREKEKALLLRVRKGDFAKDGKPTSEFYEIGASFEEAYERAKKETVLPPSFDRGRAEELCVAINRLAL